jgi:hypothetical protein
MFQFTNSFTNAYIKYYFLIAFLKFNLHDIMNMNMNMPFHNRTYNQHLKCFSVIMVGEKGTEINRGGKSNFKETERDSLNIFLNI